MTLAVVVRVAQSRGFVSLDRVFCCIAPKVRSCSVHEVVA
ncbi:hypothetical protein PAMC26577_38915 [Caballeronia sordidicola]|uniref:Uncharacterized protein n=1 Tax=Caballeronia sordidicola TaxID=196367 RepID=A0A242M3V7_CABSO|nr:hypothetical protein PAMC26577_38915 [Caballeronia sordidicola]